MPKEEYIGFTESDLLKYKRAQRADVPSMAIASWQASGLTAEVYIAIHDYLLENKQWRTKTNERDTKNTNA